MSVNDPLVGREVLNYRIKYKIGEGGMGSVYLAEHLHIHNKVAIKVIASDLANSYAKSKLKEEATILTTLAHENIVKFVNYDIDSDGVVYLVMEYADGIRLDEYVHTVTGPIVEERVAPVIEPIIDAIGYAHEKNILHRDIKPSNIMVSPDGDIAPKVLDFGIAGVLNEYGDLNDGVVVGTPAYMSPEQIKGGKLDSRSDIYSLGVLLHYLLTASVPYDVKSISEAELNRRITEEELPRMKSFYPYVSDKMQAIVDKATNKDPKKRYQTCAEFKKAIHSAIYPSKWEKYRKQIVAAILGVIFILAGIIGYSIMPKYEYYQDYTEVWGVPKGLGKVSHIKAKSMSSVYKFRFKGGHLDSVAHVNSRGCLCADDLITHEDRPVAMSVRIQSNGYASKIKAYDQFGKCLYVKSFNDNMTSAVFQYDDSFGTEKTLGAGKITRWLLTHDSSGFIEKVQYAGYQNVRVGDNDGIYGKRFIRDEKGRVVEEHFLAFNDSLKATKWGLCKLKMQYDSDGHLIMASFHSTDDTPSTSTPDDCINSYSLSYERNNLVSVMFLDAQGRPVISTRQGAAGLKYTYSKGLLSCIEALGLDGNVIFCNDGYAKKVIEYDANGYISRIMFYDTQDKLCPSFDGIASYSYVNDNKGAILKLNAYGIDGNPKESEDGIASTESLFDHVGNVIMYRQYDSDGKPCAGATGTAGYRCSFNAFGLKTELVNIGIDGNATKDVDGRIRITYEYDTKGNVVKESYLMADCDSLCHDNNGVSCVKYQYDDNGNLIERSFFNNSDEAVNSRVGFHREIISYDLSNNPVKFRYLKVDGSLVSGVDYRYDERGNILEEKPINVKGSVSVGTYIVRYTYDSRDNVTSVSYFGANEQPVSGPEGYHSCVRSYNDRNQIIMESYQNANGKLTKYSKESYSLVKNEFNDRGEVRTQTYFDENGKPVLCHAGYASRSMEYDNDNRVAKAFYFDEDLQPIVSSSLMPEMIYEYDKWGNQTYVAYADGMDNLVMNSVVGYSIRKSRYDVSGHVLEVSFYDNYSSPVVASKPLYHKAAFKYDDRGNLVEEAYYDTFGKPMLYNGVSKIENKYDATSKLSKQISYDIDNNAIADTPVVDENESLLGSNYSLSEKVFEYNRNALPESYELSDGVILTFSSIAVENGSVVASFSINKSRYDMEEEVLDQIKSQISSSASLAKRIMKLNSISFKTLCTDKNGNKVSL